MRDVNVEVGFEALEGLPVLAAKEFVLKVSEDLLGTRQLEVALTILEVRVLLGVVRVAEVRVVRHFLVDVAGQVEALATRAGDRHDRGVAEGSGVGEQVR